MTGFSDLDTSYRYDSILLENPRKWTDLEEYVVLGTKNFFNSK